MCYLRSPEVIWGKNILGTGNKAKLLAKAQNSFIASHPWTWTLFFQRHNIKNAG